ncbi:hypothetical protein [Planctomyces sp. SH-PL62]|uniref:hypothetical protein n=1 Tax=Planctomyces sp. SH-PL62 TaxID=1636152 RepID=UPI00078E7000|nr:hypothetical protein [Planctomyces sp. SH-PL62]AMV40897.1 hypothetical protein VT85_25915 [Planctomyces sp. SH-PL62]
MSDEIDPSRLEGDMTPQGRYKPARELKELHENTDLDLKGVLVNTFILIALCGATFYVVKLGMDYFVRVEDATQESRLSLRFASPPPPPAPLLQDDPAKETRVILDEARARLDSYGWNDRQAKTAHIPIERAIAILAEKGLPKVGKMDPFHPRQGSSNPVKVGDPSNPVEPPVEAPKAEAAPAPSPGPNP